MHPPGDGWADCDMRGMLSIAKLRGGGAAALYYESQVASGREDYYDEGGEAPGYWIGSGSPAAGHAGLVGEGELGALLDGDGLRRPPGERGVAGFDLTFRAPKSVSLVWALGDPEVSANVRDAHDAAVGQALGYLERQACWARRGHDGVVQIAGLGFVGAAYRHRVSRAEDPLLHTHVVIGNVTRGADGRWTALDARHLYRHAKAAGFVYQAVLRDELTVNLGLEWTGVENGTAEIAGVPRRVINAFSRRRAQITQQLALRGLSSARAAQIATLDTRDAKPMPRSFARLQLEWRTRAEEWGLDGPALNALLDRDQPAEQLSIPDPEVLTEHDSTFGRPEMIQWAAASQRRGATAGEIDALADDILQRPELVAVGERRAQAGLDEERWSTLELLEAEHSLIAAARSKREGPAADRDVVEAVTASRPTLSDDQSDLVLELTLSTRAIEVVRAPAGTGKTFAMDAAREAWDASEIEVAGAALSARAAVELHDQTGMRTTTIASLKHSLEHGYDLPDRSVLIVDEAGMVGTRDLAEIAAAAERADAKLILVGDDRQLAEIQAGGAFRAVAREVPCHALDDVLRQHEPWDRDALSELRAGDLQSWADAYVDHDRVTVADDAWDACNSLVDDWHDAHQRGGDNLMLAQRRQDVAELNAAARDLLHRDGELGDDLIYGDRAFAVGDRVITTRTDRRNRTVNGERATITRADEAGVDIQPDNADCDPIHIDREQLEHGDLDHGYAMTVHKAQGATVDNTFTLLDDRAYREWAYTALSRHRDTAQVYLTNDTLAGELDKPGDDIAARLAELVSRSRAKELAIEPERQPDLEAPDSDAPIVELADPFEPTRPRKDLAVGPRLEPGLEAPDPFEPAPPPPAPDLDWDLGP